MAARCKYSGYTVCLGFVLDVAELPNGSMRYITATWPLKQSVQKTHISLLPAGCAPDMPKTDHKRCI